MSIGDWLFSTWLIGAVVMVLFVWITQPRVTFRNRIEMTIAAIAWPVTLVAVVAARIIQNRK